MLALEGPCYPRDPQPPLQLSSLCWLSIVYLTLSKTNSMILAFMSLPGYKEIKLLFYFIWNQFTYLSNFFTSCCLIVNHLSWQAFEQSAGFLEMPQLIRRCSTSAPSPAHSKSPALSRCHCDLHSCNQEEMQAASDSVTAVPCAASVALHQGKNSVTFTRERKHSCKTRNCFAQDLKMHHKNWLVL